MGSAEIRAHGRNRRVTVYGEDPISRAFNMRVAVGQYLPPTTRAIRVPMRCWAPKVRDELFGSANPLGATLQVGSNRFRVIGVMAPRARCSASTSTTRSTSPPRALEVFSREGDGNHVAYCLVRPCMRWSRTSNAS
jgi:putative ABC transport system permease protein